MLSENHNEMLNDSELDLVKKGFEWLSSQQISSIKELSSTVSAHSLWGCPNPYITQLILKKKDGSWDSSIRDTSRACSALSNAGIVFMESEKWLLSQKTNDSWNNDVYDTTYALSALADMKTPDKEGCLWLYENYYSAWEQVGTTSLIITALKKQEKLAQTKNFETFIKERASWILSKKEQDNGWNHISTSNLVIQALILAGFKAQIKDSIHWLFKNVHNNGAWGNKKDEINATALTLTTLGLYKEALKTEIH
ncbi:MAG: hypothetical protein ACPK85_03440 [Methanosarcina sp.]